MTQPAKRIPTHESTTFDHGYALLIGVGETADPAWSLPVTVKDVQAIQRLLTDPERCAYPDNEQHVRRLCNAEAARQGILDGLAWLTRQAAADPEATVVIYYSGHGWLDAFTGRYYLIPHDVMPADIPGSALSADDFSAALHGVPAQRLLVFVDSCHAEGMASAKDEPGLPTDFLSTGMPKCVIDSLKHGEGRAVFTSSRGAQRSWVRPDQTMSLYTYHLLEALQGAGNQPGDTVVRVSNLMNHVGKTVSESARVLCQAEQTPFFDAATEDFPVALLRGGTHEANDQPEVREKSSETTVIIQHARDRALQIGQVRGGVVIQK